MARATTRRQKEVQARLWTDPGRALPFSCSAGRGIVVQDAGPVCSSGRETTLGPVWARRLQLTADSLGQSGVELPERTWQYSGCAARVQWTVRILQLSPPPGTC